MKTGIGYREFSEIAKCAFVDVSTSDYGLRGRPTNISRVAVMTGLTRKEVKRIRDKIASGNQVKTSKVNPPTEILHQWHTDQTFLDQSGNPLALPFEGNEPTFGGLVKKYGGDIPPGAMRTELLRVKAIEETDRGLLRVAERYYRPTEKDRLVKTGLGMAVSGLACAVDHNLSESEQNGRWVQRVASTTRIRQEDKGRVRRIAQDRAAEFVTSVDDLFAAYETIYPSEDLENTDGPEDTSSIVGVGVYYFETSDGVPSIVP